MTHKSVRGVRLHPPSRVCLCCSCFWIYPLPRHVGRCVSSVCKTHPSDWVIDADNIVNERHLCTVCVCVSCGSGGIPCARAYGVWYLLSCLWCPEGYPGGYPATAPTYTPNLYQTGSPGYPPGEPHQTHKHSPFSLWLWEQFLPVRSFIWCQLGATGCTTLLWGQIWNTNCYQRRHKYIIFLNKLKNRFLLKSFNNNHLWVLLICNHRTPKQLSNMLLWNAQSGIPLNVLNKLHTDGILISRQMIYFCGCSESCAAVVPPWCIRNPFVIMELFVIHVLLWIKLA